MFQSPREICEYALKNFPGDIVEIGGGFGDNTIEFLKLARAYKRKVFVIDPFEEGWGEMPHSYQYQYGNFMNKIKGYEDILTVHKRNSLCETSEKLCSSLDISFAYVDGLQFKGAVLSDLRIVDHSHVIAVDDFDRESLISQVTPAIHEYIFQTNKRLINSNRWAVLTK